MVASGKAYRDAQIVDNLVLSFPEYHEWASSEEMKGSFKS